MTCAAIAAVLYLIGYHFWSPLIFVALTPFVVAGCQADHWWRASVLALGFGWTGFALLEFPLWVHSLAVVVGALGQGLTLIPVILAVRGLWRRWKLPLTLTWPIAWTAGECLRLLGPFGSPFGALTAPLTEQLWIIQIADLGGAHFVSMPVAATQGFFADLTLACLRKRERDWSRGLAAALRDGNVRRLAMATIGIWSAVAVYGFWRLHEVRQTMISGPRIAVVQTDIPKIHDAPASYDPDLLREKLQRLSEAAVRGPNPPQLVVWPEGGADFPIYNRGWLKAPLDPRLTNAFAQDANPVRLGEWKNAWRGHQQRAAETQADFNRWINRLGVPVLVGMRTQSPAPSQSAEAFHNFNAAVLFDPRSGERTPAQRKIRLFPVGEYDPFAGTLLAGLLASANTVFTPGQRRHRFELEDGSSFTIGICSEMQFPVLAGSRRDDQPADFLINLANERSFLRNDIQLFLHRCAIYRAVEGRMGVARSSNSGISGFYDPTGRHYGAVTNAAGQMRAGRGAPELQLIEELIAYRRRHEASFATNAAKRKELNRRIAEIEAVRAEAGVEGWSVQAVYVTGKPTLFHRLGDWLSPLLFTLLALMLAAPVIRADRDSRRRAAE